MSNQNKDSNEDEKSGEGGGGTEYALTEKEESLVDSLDNEFKDLSPKEQEYVNLRVFTDMTKKEIGSKLNYTYYQMSKIEEKDSAQKFKKEIQKAYQRHTLSTLKKQNKFIQNQMWLEIKDRLREPDPENDLSENASIGEREAYMERFIYNVSFKDLMKLFDKFQKNLRLDTPDEPTERGSGDELMDSIRKRYEESKKRREKYNQMKEGKDPKDIDVDVSNDDGEVVEAELLDDDTQEENSQSKSSDDNEDDIENVDEDFNMNEFEIK